MHPKLPPGFNMTLNGDRQLGGWQLLYFPEGGWPILQFIRLFIHSVNKEFPKLILKPDPGSVFRAGDTERHKTPKPDSRSSPCPPSTSHLPLSFLFFPRPPPFLSSPPNPPPSLLPSSSLFSHFQELRLHAHPSPIVRHGSRMAREASVSGKERSRLSV